MSWTGYFKYGDTEIINATRARAYADALGLAWVKNTAPDGIASPALGEFLGETYTHPALDAAPWYDPDIPQSANFAGLIPLSATGMEDSTRESSTFEFTGDGGNPGSLREATKPIVFSVALFGVNEEAVDYGFKWLKRALRKRSCAPGAVTSCRGERLYFARAMPVLSPTHPRPLTLPHDLDGGDAYDDDETTYDGGGAFPIDGPSGGPTEQWLNDFERHFENVLFNRGPVVNSKRTLKGCNGVIWIVGFTATAGSPFEFGPPIAVLDGLGQGSDPHVAPYTGDWGTTTYTAISCPSPVFSPVYDPLAPALVAPPAPPNIAPANFVPPTGLWDRQYADLPASVIPLWDEVRPVITLRSDTEARMLWIRIFPDELADNAACGSVGEFVISYLPPDVDFIIDAAQEAVMVDDGTGVIQRADSVVFGSRLGLPLKWFGLSCGDGYRITLDWDADTAPDVDMSLSLVPRSA